MNNSHLEKISRAVSAPEFILPWLDRFYEPIEIRLLNRFPHTSTDADTLKKALDIGRDTLDRCVLRGVLSKDRDGRLSPAGFHTRYDIWAVFEGFKDIPDKIRDRLNQWELDHYIRTCETDVEEIRRTGRLDPSRVLPRYLLLDQALDVLDEADHIYLWPCNCRSMVRACKKPVFTCLRFDNSQGQGFEISREKAREIVRDANKKGLMQSGELGWSPEGKLMGAICNCCADCCFPHLLAKEKNAEKIWPKSLAIASWKKNICSYCGLCAKRCPFDAFQYDRQQTQKSTRITFDEERCRGCGLCAVTCPETAIEMKKIEEPSNA